VHAYALGQDFAALMLEESADMPARYDTSRAAVTAITARIACTLCAEGDGLPPGEDPISADSRDRSSPCID